MVCFAVITDTSSRAYHVFEGASCLAGLERQGREQERTFYLEAWAGDSSFTMDRIARGKIHAEYCGVSLFGGIQPSVLRSYLADALGDGRTNDGLMQRFQMLIWPDFPSRYSYVDLAENRAAFQCAETVYRRLSEIDAGNPLLLKFATDAQELFIEWLTDLETRIRMDDTSPVMQAHLSKFRSLMPTLALLFTIADDSAPTVVDLKYAKQAAAWCEYLEAHAGRYGAPCGLSVTRKRRQLLTQVECSSHAIPKR
jgi:hypothetical protein